MENALKKALTENGAMDKLRKAMNYINEESEIADRGEFFSKTDAEYLHHGNQLLKEFNELLTEVLNKHEK